MSALPPPITSRTNARVKALRASLSGEAGRNGDLLGLEGLHLLREAGRAGLSLDTLYLRAGDEDLLEREPWLTALRVAHWVVLAAEVFESAASTGTPQGIAATWAIKAPSAPQDGAEGCVLILENLRDPGNLGTLIRSAEAFGASHVLLTPGTVNQWNPKVVRSSAGGSFRMPVSRAALGEIVQALRSEGVRLFAAVAPSVEVTPPADVGRANAASMSSLNADLSGPCAILIGNEGAGLSPEARAAADAEVVIPCQAESLNAAIAGSVLLYEAMRQRLRTTGARR